MTQNSKQSQNYKTKSQSVTFTIATCLSYYKELVQC